MKQIEVRIGGITGKGKNRTEATANAIDKLDAMDSEGFAPYVVSHPFYNGTMFVFRCSAENWSYTYLDDTVKETTTPHHSAWHPTREQAIYGARFHMAQRCCRIESDEQSGLEFLAGIPGMATAAREHLSWLAWQRSYKALIAANVPPMEAHGKATNDLTLVTGLIEKFFPSLKKAA